MPQTSPNGPGGSNPPTPHSKASKLTVPASVESTHQMMVALIIFVCVGFLLIILAGESPTVGNSIAGILFIMLLVQGFTHVSVIAEFLTKHPLKPATH